MHGLNEGHIRHELEQLERLHSEDSNFLILKRALHATHLLKLLDKMCKYEMDPMSIVEDTERTWFCPQTDRQIDGQTDKVIPVYPPINFVEAGGIIRSWDTWIQAIVMTWKWFPHHSPFVKGIHLCLAALLALCEGNQPGTGGFPSPRASNVEFWYFHCC